mmetsp:Transcript_5338/g.11226  ORF Transcript_5338/g.11226 Transcript_5338/m.11226 type:complete len:544 (-) Transcript_5338:414-2045(-)
MHDVVRVARVAHGVGAAQQHLERHVWNELAQRLESLPRALAQEPHGHVERRAAPHFERVRAAQNARRGGRNRRHVDRAQSRGQQRLMRVAPRRVAHQRVRERAHRFRKPFRAFRFQHLLPARRRRRRRVDERHHWRQVRRRLRRVRAGHWMAVDVHFAEVSHELVGAVFLRREMKQLRVHVDEVGRHLLREEHRVRKNFAQERDVCVHAAHAELTQRARQLLRGKREAHGVRGRLDQQRIIMRRDHRASKPRRRVQPNPHAFSRPERVDAPVVRQEVVPRVFGRHAALNRVPARGNLVLRQPELRKRVSIRDLDLRLHNVDASHFLRHRVLDLHARVHLDEVMPPFLINQKLHRTRVFVVGLLRELDRVGPQLLAERERNSCGRSDLHDFLMAALHGAIAFEKMHHVSGSVRNDLHLDVPRAVHKPLDEDRAVPKRRKSLALAKLHGFHKLFRLAHHAHSAPSASMRGLNNHRKPNPACALHKLARGVHRRNRPGRARNDGHICFQCELARFRLVSKPAEHAVRWAHEANAVIFTRLGKPRVF